MSLRSILGDSNRVKKKQGPSSSRPSTISTSSSSPWPTNLQRRKPSSSGNLSEKQPTPSRHYDHDQDDDQDILNHPLDDHGLVAALTTDMRLRDVPQAVRHARENMFAPLPTRGTSSALRMTLASRRECIPPVVSAAHVQALLTATPTAVERETVELVRAGVLRRVDVPTRGVAGEVLVLAADYEALVGRAQGLDDGTREAYAAMLRDRPGAATVVAGPDSGLGVAQVEKLFRAGFLTSAVQGRAAADGIFSRPEDRTTLLSLATVARAPSGTVWAVGGQGGAREHATGRGGAGSPWPAGGGTGTTEYRIAVPGAGAFLKLVTAALEHFKTLLARLPHREAPEYLLKEKWEGGTAKGSGVQEAARLARGEKVGTLPGRTRRWRDFMGLQFEWILAEAVGAGMVEVFETGSVGRGVRLLVS
ncbi:hypothetical protein MGG_04367 [Pyricularia oryzae 70-15]|uniref:Serine-threonine protein kinase 19 n=1 Tax=Pyricularia oryzae (strain 70-15 / ATCC MYA-4617 / FGSC 8958) TaxID=242507 RepID=G4MZB7_PYRO7|nr:uncharacterized protein MGG_04367 [Pyricularia oryzae 70-15]EHA53672.1 hypothetical protein MGG_04367 [Pyricularia oryzae 70-15]